MHFQTGGFAEDKLARCLRGSMLDDIIDVRRDCASLGSVGDWSSALASFGKLFIVDR